MSISGEFRRITVGQLEGLLEQARHEPEAFDNFLTPETRVFDRPDPKLNIGKSWQAIHFLLNGALHQITCVAGRVVFGGQEAGRDLAYGPARYMNPTEVKEVSEALRVISEEAFAARFEPEVFKAIQIYPQGDWGGVDSLQWLWETFEALRDFYKAGADCGDVMLLYLS